MRDRVAVEENSEVTRKEMAVFLLKEMDDPVVFGHPPQWMTQKNACVRWLQSIVRGRGEQREREAEPVAAPPAAVAETTAPPAG